MVSEQKNTVLHFKFSFFVTYITHKIDYGYVAIAVFTCHITNRTTKKQVSNGSWWVKSNKCNQSWASTMDLYKILRKQRNLYQYSENQQIYNRFCTILPTMRNISKGLLFYLFLHLIQMNFIFSDHVHILFLHSA